MAMVDFSNAVLSLPTNIPLQLGNVGLNGNFCTDANGNGVGSMSKTQTKKESKNAEFTYSGTFYTSGTEFYFGESAQDLRWKVSGISFQSGDTFSFAIPLTLTCL